MFEDLEEEAPEVTVDSPDRALAWAIHTRGGAGDLPPDEAWAILHERYAADGRFLLLSSYAALAEARKSGAGASVWTPAYLLATVTRVLDGLDGALAPHVRDLLAFGGAVLAAAKGEDAKRLGELRAQLGADGALEASRDERDRAGLRLRRFEREVVKELHARTEGGRPLGERAAAPPRSPAAEWAAAVADDRAPRRRYVADGRFARGELVEHPKFGVGVVTATEPGKAVILFESGARKLVAGA